MSSVGPVEPVVFTGPTETRSQAPALERISPKLRFDIRTVRRQQFDPLREEVQRRVASDSDVAVVVGGEAGA